MLYAACLFASLAHPDFTAREMASTRLARLVSDRPHIYGPAVAHWAVRTESPEARRRAVPMVASWRHWVAVNYVPKTVTMWPICDAYPQSCGALLSIDVRCKCTWPVESKPSDRGGPYWDGYRRTTEGRVRGLIRDGMSYEDADALMARMWLLEMRALSDCGHLPDLPERWMGGYPAR
jgi:hypothetical protein